MNEHFHQHPFSLPGSGTSPKKPIFPSQKAYILQRRRMRLFGMTSLIFIVTFTFVFYLWRPEMFEWRGVTDIFLERHGASQQDGWSTHTLEHLRSLDLAHLQRNKNRERIKLVSLITTGTNFHKMALMRKAHRNSRNIRYFFILGDQNQHSWFTRFRVFLQQIWYRDIWIGPMKDQDESKSTCVMVENSSTTKKVFWGIREAWKRFDFQFLVRLGDDAYFRAPFYLQEKIPLMVPFFEFTPMSDGPLEHSESTFSNIQELNLDMDYHDMMDNQHISDSFTNYEKKSPVGFFHGHFWGPGSCDNTFYGAKWKYALGMGYVLSQNVAEFVANLSPQLLQKSAPEDAVLSSWILPLHIKYIHDTAFHNVAKVKGFSLNNYEPHAWKKCTPSDILLHYVTPPMYNQIGRSGVMKCHEEDYKCVSGKVCNIPTPKGYRNVDDSGVDMDTYAEAFLHPSKNLPSTEVVEERRSLIH